MQVAQELPVMNLIPYRDHPFRLYDGQRLQDMVRSVREVGILIPVVVRDAEGGTYEILAGHNRVNAAKHVGLDTVPARVLENISDELAALIVTESNLCQRSFSDLSHSERAVALKAHMDALKSQGRRMDIIAAMDRLNAGEEDTEREKAIAPKGEARSLVGEKFDLSPATVSRYVRLASLHRELLGLVDEGKIAFLAGVELAGLSDKTQDHLAAFLDRERLTLTVKHAKALKDAASSSRGLDEEQIHGILTGAAFRKPKAGPTAKTKPKIWKKYLPANTPAKDIESTIEKALAFYFENGGGE